MKNLLTFLAVILCSVGAFGQGAQYRPTPYANGFVQTVTSTGTAQTYLGIGSSTNNALLSGTNVFSGTNTLNTNTILGTAKLQDTLDSKPTVALTNVARLDQSQTWTGTPTFPAAVFESNGIGFRLLYSSGTNINIASAAVVALGSVTNAGNFTNCTQLAEIDLPALGTNEHVMLSMFVETPAQSSSCSLAIYAGANTNYVGSTANGIAGTAAQRSGGNIFSSILANAGSQTNQLQGASLTQVPFYGPTNYCDTSGPFKLYIGAFTATSATNINIRHLKVFGLR